MSSDFNLADLYRRIENIIRIGLITECDYANKQVRVELGEIQSNWIDWPCNVSANFKQWQPLKVGTQVVLGCPSADIAQALIIGKLYTDAIDAPSTDKDVELIEFEDGSKVEYKKQDGQITVKAKTKVVIDAPNAHFTGNITADGDVSDSTRSMSADRDIYNSHAHPGVGATTQKQ